MSKTEETREIEITPEMIEAGERVLNAWFNSNWPDITPIADSGLVSEILRSGMNSNRGNYS